jgi:arsenate reductase-like glutaredoxin family protein
MDHIEKYINITEQRIKKGKYNSKKDPCSKDILIKFHNRLKIYYERYSGDDETRSKKDNKKFEELTKEHIINELCNFKNDVTRNFRSILLEIQEEPEPRDNKSIDIVSQEFDDMIREIDQLKKVLNEDIPNSKNNLLTNKIQNIQILSDDEEDDEDDDEEDQEDQDDN